LPGERERPCEIVTPPLGNDQDALLGALLAEARTAGFSLPLEGATHIHFDAGPPTSAGAITNLVGTLTLHGDALKRLVGTNPNCIRLGKWPDKLPALVVSPGFAALDWPAARKALSTVGLEKYCDSNLLNIATANRAKHTFATRLSSSLSTAQRRSRMAGCLSSPP
jgi:Putative amidoligase enzyme